MEDVQTYAMWEATAETEYSEQPGGRSSDTDRAVYKVDGVYIYDHTVFPHNFLKKPYKYTVVGLQFPVTPENEAAVAKFGGSLETDWYCTDGYLMPTFGERDGKDPLEKAWNFIKGYKNTELNGEDYEG